MVEIGDIVLFFQTPRQISSVISGVVKNTNNIILNTIKGPITSLNRSPVVGEKVIVFQTKKNTKLSYIPGTCADAFRRYTLEITPTNGTPYTTNNTIAIYDNMAYIVGVKDGKIGFAVFNGNGFDYYMSPYSLTYATIDITDTGIVWIVGVAGNDLCAAYYDGTWHYEVVTSEGGYLMYPNLKIDNNNIPYILYTSPFGWDYSIKLANRIGGSWSTETIESYTNAWGNPPTALTFDDLNHPHYVNASQWGGASPCKEYGYNDGLAWYLEDTNAINDIALDSDRFPHGSNVWYTTTNYVYHLYKDGAGWHSEEVHTGEGLTRIKVHNGEVHILNSGGEGFEWNYKDIEGNWHYCLVDSLHATGYQSFINFDFSQDGHMHVSYYSEGNGFFYLVR